MAAQPVGVNSVPIVSWLVSHQRAGNEHLLFWDSGFRTQSMKIIEKEICVQQQIIFFMWCKREWEKSFPSTCNLWTHQKVLDKSVGYCALLCSTARVPALCHAP